MNSMIWTMKAAKRAALLTAVVMGALLLSACDDWSFFWDMGEEWATSEGMISDDGVNIGRVTDKIANDAFDTLLGAPEMTALEAGQIADDIDKADALADEGAENGDLDKIEEAMRLRPEDWTYSEMYAAAALQKRDYRLYQDTRNNDAKRAEQRIAAGADCVSTWRSLYEHRIAAFEQQLARNAGDSVLQGALDSAKHGLAVSPSFCP